MLIFECLPLFLLTLFWPPPFSLPLSRSLSCSFLSSFLSFFACFLLVPVLSLHFLYSLLLFHEKNNMKLLIFKVFSSILSLFWFPLLFSLSNPFFLSLLFPDFSLCFLFNINVFAFKRKDKLKTTIFQKRGCNKTFFVYEALFCKMWKAIAFLGPFFAKFWLMFKSTISIGISAHFIGQKMANTYHFEVLASGPSKCYYLGQVRCNLKIANLAQMLTPQICARDFFVQKNVLNPLLL